MKIGDYVRTDYGISKIIGIYPEKTMTFIETDNGLGNCNFSSNGKLIKGIAVLEEDYRNFIDNNIKEKPIDLIEIGDYVNGYRVAEIETLPTKQKLVVVGYGYDADEISENNIKSIVTREMFESMEYKIGE